VDVPIRLYSHALELDPGNALATNNLATTERLMGHPEKALADFRKGLALLSSKGQGEIRDDFVTSYRLLEQAAVDGLLGDFRNSALENADAIQSEQSTAAGASGALARIQVNAHDIGGARATLADPLPETPGQIDTGAFINGEAKIEIAAMMQDWDEALRQAALLQPVLQKHPRDVSQYHLTGELVVAQAEAKLGRFAEAEARIANTPGDCYTCLRARARIAEAEGQHARADWWFERAMKSNPSIPLAYSEWGQALLERGQPDAAIEKFTIANRQGPHFADPLEGWGEALMKENRSDRALAKFEEAEKYAPNWGRLHLKLGEALVHADKRDEARRQFEAAEPLGLTPSERGELGYQRRVNGL